MQAAFTQDLHQIISIEWMAFWISHDASTSFGCLQSPINLFWPLDVRWLSHDLFTSLFETWARMSCSSDAVLATADLRYVHYNSCLFHHRILHGVSSSDQSIDSWVCPSINIDVAPAIDSSRPRFAKHGDAWYCGSRFVYYSISVGFKVLTLHMLNWRRGLDMRAATCWIDSELFWHVSSYSGRRRTTWNWKRRIMMSSSNVVAVVVVLWISFSLSSAMSRILPVTTTHHDSLNIFSHRCYLARLMLHYQLQYQHGNR